LEELLLSFSLDLMLFKELIEQGMGISFLREFVWSRLDRVLEYSESVSGSDSSSEREEGFIEIKKGPQ
jgi:hypothetical protein